MRAEGGNLFQFPDDYGQIIPSIVAAPGTGAGNGGDDTTAPTPSHRSHIISIVISHAYLTPFVLNSSFLAPFIIYQ